MATGVSLRTADGQEYPVEGALRIGRAPECEILLPDDLVSRLHARVWLEGDRLLIGDEGSSNGTFVNGRALARSENYRLKPGDTVRVGHTTLTVVAAGSGVMQGAAQTVVLPPVAAPVPPPAPPPTTTRIDGAGQTARPAGPASSNRSRSVLVGGCLVLVLLAVCGGLGLFGATAGRPILATALAPVGGAATPAPAARSTPSPGAGTTAVAPATPGAAAGSFTVQIVSTSPPATPLAPADYAKTGQDLAAALAALNQAQLHFIADTQSNQAGLDEDLRTVAANAFRVGLDGETLTWATAAQDGGSDTALALSELYAGLARYGFAQAIDAQNLRTYLATGPRDTAAAAAQIADYGARAWNPTVTDPAVPGNPFQLHLAHGDLVPAPAPVPPAGQAAVASALGAGAGAFTWLAAPSETVTRTVSLPLAPPLDNAQDPALLAALITPAGQADARRAQQDAAAGLLRLGASRQRPTGRHPAGVLAALWSPPEQAANDSIAFSAPRSMLLDDTPKAGSLHGFPNGHAAAAAANPPASGSSTPTIIDTLFGTDANNQPAQQGTVPVENKPAAVSLTISNVKVVTVNQRPKGSSTFEADVNFTFDVQWNTSLANPQFTLSCNNGLSSSITTATGTQNLSANGLLILYPGTLTIYCYASSSNGQSLGSTSLNVLVGDPAAATQRAIQVETDSAALDLTLTADAVGTQSAESTNAAATRSVLGTQNALETEQAASQTAEFRATITAIAHLTEVAVPAATEIPSATATFVPVLVETLQHPGNVFAVSTKIVLQPNRLYQFCFSGTVNLINPVKAAKASDIDHVNGVAVPISGCMVVEGNGKAAVISCGSGEVAEDPGGFTIQVVDLGPS